jgi:hypothetical protein
LAFIIRSVFGSGGMAPLILELGSRLELSASGPVYFTRRVITSGNH